MSATGTPSVMQTTKGRPASTASAIASGAKRAGTAMSEAFGPVAVTASATVLKTGTPATDLPAAPGVTPATTLVPY